MSPSIAIIGGGPSGLMLARLLDLAGIDFVVFERDPDGSVVSQGGTLDIHADSGQLALKEGGLFGQFKQHARYDGQSTIIADKSGNVVEKLEINDEGGGHDRPEIDRKDLRKLLMDSIPASKIRWDSRVQCICKRDDGTLSVHFNDGSSASGFQLVVGADGAWSKVRCLITSAQPEYSGHYNLTTTIAPQDLFHSNAEELAGRGNYMAFSSGRSIVVQRMSNASYNITIGIPLEEHWRRDTSLLTNPAALRSWLLEHHFADWNNVNSNVIRHSERAFAAWPLYAIPQESLSWVPVSGATLVGDAAHLTVPSGEGVNIALYDGLQLARSIIKFGVDDLRLAVEEYEKSMFPRAVAHSKGAIKMMKVLNSERAPYNLMEAHGDGDFA